MNRNDKTTGTVPTDTYGQQYRPGFPHQLTKLGNPGTPYRTVHNDAEVEQALKEGYRYGDVDAATAPSASVSPSYADVAGDTPWANPSGVPDDSRTTRGQALRDSRHPQGVPGLQVGYPQVHSKMGNPDRTAHNSSEAAQLRNEGFAVDSPKTDTAQRTGPMFPQAPQLNAVQPPENAEPKAAPKVDPQGHLAGSPITHPKKSEK